MTYESEKNENRAPKTSSTLSKIKKNKQTNKKPTQTDH